MRVLVIDDEAPIRRMLRLLLSAEGYQVVEAATAAEGMSALASGPFDAVLLDVQLPDRSGLDLVPDVARNAPAVRILIMTAFGSIPSAVEAMRNGAWDYLTKPFDNDDLLQRLDRIREVRRLEDEVASLRDELAGRYGFGEMVGSSPRMADVFSTIRKVGPLDATVLVHGESGTGKELVARAIHRASPRHTAPFVPVNCGAIPETLVEDTFFGHRRGAFTGADRDRSGLFEEARGGTLFLDELGELPGDAQASLLRVLQERSVTPLGGTQPVDVDVRLVCATNVDLEAAVAERRFREDLFWRVSMVTVRVPPLRERPEDIPALVDHLVHRWSAEIGVPPRTVSTRAMEVMCRYAWPGNVRELENTLYRALVMAEGDEIAVADLPPRVTGSAPRTHEAEDDRPLDELVGQVVQRVETAEIRRRLERHGFNRADTAASLGISRKTLFNKMRALGIAAPERGGDSGTS